MKVKKKKCNHCNSYFIPDKYNHHRQTYCFNTECRHASKIASRRKYRRADKNRTPKECKKESERVKRWQKEHPDYKKAQKKAKIKSEESILRDIAPAQNLILRDIAQLKKEVSLISDLHTTVVYYKCVTAGLASVLSGDVLREIIGGQLDRYYDIGNRLLLSKGKSIKTNILTERNNSNEKQSSNQCPKKTADSPTFQLGGSSSSP